MRRNFLLAFLFVVLLVAALGGCVGSLPTNSTPSVPVTPADQTTPVGSPTEPAATEVSSTQPSTVTMPLITNDDAAAPTQPVPDIAPTAPPAALPTSILAPETVRDAALDFVRGAYQIDLPANADFAPADIQSEVESVQAAASYVSGAWQMIVGAPYIIEGRIVTPAILANATNDTRWWGEVGDDGVTTTVVSARMPRPRSQRADGWVGRIIKLPSGSPFDDYFEGDAGNKHGIDSNQAEVLTLLESLTDYQGRVRVYGELRFAAPDYNGRRLLARRIDLLDPPPDETAAPLPTAPEQPAPTSQSFTPVPSTPPASGFGPVGALFSPLPRTALSEKVQVSGEAEGLFENKVIVRVETGAGEVLGAVVVAVDAAEMGDKGGFAVELPFQNPSAPTQGRVAIYSESPADGSLNLLAWVNIGLAGPSSGKSAVIVSPEPGATVEGSVQVTGTAAGMRDEVVLARVEDLAGTVLGQARSRVSAAGDWQVKFSLRKPRTARPGRIAVYGVNPADNSTTLLATVDVKLAR